jgi:hypothetical protein
LSAKRWFVLYFAARRRPFSETRTNAGKNPQKTGPLFREDNDVKESKELRISRRDFFSRFLGRKTLETVGQPASASLNHLVDRHRETTIDEAAKEVFARQPTHGSAMAGISGFEREELRNSSGDAPLP